MENKLIKTISQFTGNILCIGITNEKMISQLKRNSNINVFLLNRSVPKIGFRKSKKAVMSNGKKINIKKLEKAFNRKSIDNIICYYDEIEDYFKYFIDDSLNVCIDTIYLYGCIDDIDPEIIINRYSKYNIEISQKIEKNDFLITIKSPTKHINIIKKKWHIIVNTFKNAGDFISSVLIS